MDGIEDFERLVLVGAVAAAQRQGAPLQLQGPALRDGGGTEAAHPGPPKRDAVLRDACGSAIAGELIGTEPLPL